MHPERATFLEAQRLFFVEKAVEKADEKAYDLINPLLIKDNLSLIERRPIFELAGLIRRQQRRYQDAAYLFREIGDDDQAGYSLMLAGYWEGVQPFWQRVIQQRPNHWCMHLYGLVTHQLNTCPTLLQIRNHLETDIVELFKAGQREALENLLSYHGLLCQINMETYKYIGRALLNVGAIEAAGPYLFQAQRLLPNDPEIYYHLGEYHFGRGTMRDADLMLQQCLLISHGYVPALNLRTAVQTELQAAA
jgi:tetratricopeptide (TPR) repeat protein